MTVKIPPQKSA